jgi:hypothetical protein
MTAGGIAGALIAAVRGAPTPPRNRRTSPVIGVGGEHLVVTDAVVAAVGAGTELD